MSEVHFTCKEDFFKDPVNAFKQIAEFLKAKNIYTIESIKGPYKMENEMVYVLKVELRSSDY
jgi:hypothetical protein